MPFSLAMSKQVRWSAVHFCKPVMWHLDFFSFIFFSPYSFCVFFSLYLFHFAMVCVYWLNCVQVCLLEEGESGLKAKNARMNEYKMSQPSSTTCSYTTNLFCQIRFRGNVFSPWIVFSVIFVSLLCAEVIGIQSTGL